jgi:hypothetical protein
MQMYGDDAHLISKFLALFIHAANQEVFGANYSAGASRQHLRGSPPIIRGYPQTVEIKELERDGTACSWRLKVHAPEPEDAEMFELHAVFLREAGQVFPCIKPSKQCDENTYPNVGMHAGRSQCDVPSRRDTVQRCYGTQARARAGDAIPRALHWCPTTRFIDAYVRTWELDPNCAQHQSA